MEAGRLDDEVLLLFNELNACNEAPRLLINPHNPPGDPLRFSELSSITLTSKCLLPESSAAERGSVFSRTPEGFRMFWRPN